MFSAASIATMTACIFLFGLFFSLLINFRYIVKNAELQGLCEKGKGNCGRYAVLCP